ncbi:MAG TPA: DUF1761 domain-containing protein [Saprospiraceae bacterium]|nr:DUF1761 domain-containing protein [Saprospiraceae bacterium]HMQ84092.1 DUF1761 domain-containing protein [Saprospiraceae bacterium]
MGNKTNWLAIIVAAVAAMALGFLWYGVLFQEQWMAGNGITVEGDKMFKYGTEMPISSLPMIINTVAMIIYALMMNWLAVKSGSTTFKKGATLGAFVGFIVLLSTYVSNRFAANPTTLSMVDGVYSLALFMIIGTIVGGWRKQ